MQLLPSLLYGLKAVCATFPDTRKGRGGNIQISDFGLSAFAMFFMQSASFLAYQRALRRGMAAPTARRCSASAEFPRTTTFAIGWTRPTPRFCGPVSNAWRRCWPSPYAAIGRQNFDRMGRHGIFLLAKARLSELSDPQARQRQDRELSLPAVGDGCGAGHSKVVPLMPEFIAPQDGAEKKMRAQRCHALVRQPSRAAGAVAPRVSGRRSLRLSPRRQDGDGRWRRLHLHLQGDVAQGAPRLHRRSRVARHEEKVRRRNTKETFRYRWIEAVPLRDGKEPTTVNWIGFEILDAKGKLKYSMAWVTSLAVSKDNVAEIVACGRARWRSKRCSLHAKPICLVASLPIRPPIAGVSRGPCYREMAVRPSSSPFRGCAKRARASANGAARKGSKRIISNMKACMFP